MTSNLTVTILIPTFRRPDILADCLQGVYALQHLPNQVLVIYRPDDDPETGKWLKDIACPTYPTLKLVPVQKPGQVHAMNSGLDIAETDIVAILDDDAVPRHDWLNRILLHFNAANVGIVGGRDVVAGHPPVTETNKAGYIDFWGNIIGNHHIVVGEPREVEVVKGCNWALRRQAIGSLRFDDRLLGTGAQHGNDYWFCLNVRNAGWKIILDPKAIVDHYPAERLDHGRNTWTKHKCHDQTRNEVAARLAFYPWHLKLRFLLFHIFVGHRNCPGIYFILHSLLKRPSSLPGQLLGGWSGFLHGWQTAKQFRQTPPGVPNTPRPSQKEVIPTELEV